jgi:HlyD family secretion protein
MKLTWFKTGLGLGGALLLLSSTACTSLVPRLGSNADDLLPTTSEQTIKPDATPPTTLGGRRVVAVRRGSISDLLSLSGQIGGRDEVAMTFPARSKVDTIAVKLGQTVDQGEVLVEADSRDVAKELSAARARLETSTLRLQYAQADAANRARDGASRAQMDRAKQQGAVMDAQSALQRAQADVDRIKAGPPSADRQTAESAVAQAQAAYERAQADLDQITAGPDPAELKDAEQKANVARLALQKAEADRSKLAVPDPDQVRAAERDVAMAQAGYDRAKGDFDKLASGPDPFTVRAAERDVQQAQAALNTAQTTKGADVAAAQRGLQDAQDRLAKARQGPAPADIEVAKGSVQAAQLALDSARARLDQIRKGPDKLTLDLADAAVENARTTSDTAEARLQALQSGSPQDRVNAAQQGVDNARSALSLATARLRDLNSHPTPAEIKDAENKVTAAQAAVDRARLEADLAPGIADSASSGNLDLTLLQKSVDQDQADVAALETSLNNTRLIAPLRGVITALNVRPNESVEAGRQVLAIAPTDDAVMRAMISDDRDADRLKAGQKATVVLDGSEGTRLDATFLGLVELPNHTGTVAQLQVDWPTAVKPQFGVSGTATVLVQQKEGALIVPQKAIRTAGPRRYVEYLDGSQRRVANIEVGILSGTEAEVISGLVEGQSVLVAQ